MPLLVVLNVSGKKLTKERLFTAENFKLKDSCPIVFPKPPFCHITALMAAKQDLVPTAVKRLSMREKLRGDRIVRFEKPGMWL